MRTKENRRKQPLDKVDSVLDEALSGQPILWGKREEEETYFSKSLGSLFAVEELPRARSLFAFGQSKGPAARIIKEDWVEEEVGEGKAKGQPKKKVKAKKK